MDISAWFDQLMNWIMQLPSLSIYLFLGISAFVENVFPPVPGDTVTVFGAYLVGRGFVGFFGVYIATTIGSLVGFMTIYFLGLKLGRPFFEKPRVTKIFSLENLNKVEGYFNKYGLGVIAANRFLPGIRSIISIFGGIAKLKWWKVAIFALLSCSLWNGLLIYAGYLLGDNWKDIEFYLSRYNTIVLSIIGLLIIIFITYKAVNYYKNKKNKS